MYVCACNCVWGYSEGGCELIDSFSDSDRLWIICRHLTSWKANSGVINFSTLGLMRSQLSFSVRTYNTPLSDTGTSPKNPVIFCSDSKLCTCVGNKLIWHDANCVFCVRMCSCFHFSLDMTPISAKHMHREEQTHKKAIWYVDVCMDVRMYVRLQLMIIINFLFGLWSIENISLTIS